MGAKEIIEHLKTIGLVRLSYFFLVLCGLKVVLAGGFWSAMTTGLVVWVVANLVENPQQTIDVFRKVWAWLGRTWQALLNALD
jgi:hypothetical protein